MAYQIPGRLSILLKKGPVPITEAVIQWCPLAVGVLAILIVVWFARAIENVDVFGWFHGGKKCARRLQHPESEPLVPA